MTEEITIDYVLNALPATEIRESLFRGLGKETLLAARGVNKLWKSLVDPLLEFNLELSDKTVDVALNFGEERQVETMYVYSFHGEYPEEGFAINTNMLRINGHSGKGLSQSNFQRLIQDFNYVERLHISSEAVQSFEDLDMLKRVDLPNVTEMIITFFDEGFEKLILFLENHFPKLTTVNIANVADSTPKRPIVYPKIFEFLVRHAGTLEDVIVLFPEGRMDEVGMHSLADREVVPSLRLDHSMPEEDYQVLKSDLKKMKLKKFQLNLSKLEGRAGRYDLGVTLLYNQVNLTALHLDDVRSLNVWREIPNILRKQSRTLVNLYLGGCFCRLMQDADFNPALHEFNCTWVKNCKKLEKLEIVVCGVNVTYVKELPKGSLRLINLGYAFVDDDIDYIALGMMNLGTDRIDIEDSDSEY